MTTKAKDGRETLQERLQARIDKHRDPRGNICLGTYNHWDSALDLEAIGSLDAAQAEIARLTKDLQRAEARDSGGHAPDGVTWKHAWMREAEWRGRAVDAANMLIDLCAHADFRNGNTDESQSCDEGERLAAGIIEQAKALLPEQAPLRQPEADTGYSVRAETIIAGIKQFGLAADGSDLRDLQALVNQFSPQPEAAPEGYTLVPNVALKWLHGEGPDHDGKWFGQVGEEGPSTKHPRPYWWRSHFRKICNAISGRPVLHHYDKLSRSLVASAPTPASAPDNFEDRLKELLGCEIIAGANTIRDLRKLTAKIVALHFEALASTPAPASAQDLVMALNAALAIANKHAVSEVVRLAEIDNVLRVALSATGGAK